MVFDDKNIYVLASYEYLTREFCVRVLNKKKDVLNDLMDLNLITVDDPIYMAASCEDLYIYVSWYSSN